MAACPAYFLTSQTIGNVYIFPVLVFLKALERFGKRHEILYALIFGVQVTPKVLQSQRFN